LYNAGHAKGLRSYGGVWGGQFATYHHNLIANQNSRAVRFNGARAHDTLAIVDYYNNVIYNWGSANAAYGGDIKINGGVSQVNMVNNYYKPGPATANVLKFMHALYDTATAKGVGQWYLSGNVMQGNNRLTKNNRLGLDLELVPKSLRNQAVADQPFNLKEPLTAEVAEQAYASVLVYAGANMPKRDTVDARVVTETKSETAKGMGSFGKPGIIDRADAVGGWHQYQSLPAPADSDEDGMPDEWEKANGLDPHAPADRNKTGNDGYTMLENYLNSLAGNSIKR
jgi:hypothetical protein